MSIKRIFASSKITADSGKVAFSRGPLVYCAERVDNAGDVFSLRVKKEGEIEAYSSEKLNGIVEIKVDGYKVSDSKLLYSTVRPEVEPCKITLIPYYTWGNRGLNQMRVWLPEE